MFGRPWPDVDERFCRGSAMQKRASHPVWDDLALHTGGSADNLAPDAHAGRSEHRFATDAPPVPKEGRAVAGLRVGAGCWDELALPSIET